MINYINPVAFQFGNMEVRWYAICILIGILLALWHGIKEGKKLGISSDFIYLGLIIILPVSILGARLWWYIFNVDEISSLSEFLGLQGGLSGLAIQGGVIAAIISVYIYCKKRHVALYKVLDILAVGLILGQICGRWGNFCNHELYGGAVENTDLFLKLLPSFITDNMYIKGSYLLKGLSEGYYHPMFLYESMLNLLGLIIIFVVRRKWKGLKSGDLVGFYLVWYGVVRCITESFRLEGEVLLFAGVRVSIVTSICFIVCGLAFLIIKRFIGPKKGYIECIEEVSEKHSNTLIFDLDGTLINSYDWIKRSFIHTFEHFYPEHILTDDELKSFFGPTLMETFAKYAKDEEEVKEMIEYYRKYNWEAHDNLVKIFPNVSNVLSTLSHKGYNLAIVSSKTKEGILRSLDYFNITQYFDIIIGCGEVTKYKPDPEGILKALDYFKDVKNPIYFGDTTGDIKTGKSANIKTCGALYGAMNEDILSSEPDYFINNFNDILKIVCE